MTEPKKRITFDIPPGSRVSSCRSCEQRIAFVAMPSGKVMPVEVDGIHVGESHSANCVGAAAHRKPKASS